MAREDDTALLEKEYFHLQGVVEAFDAKSLTIKAWSVTLGVGVASSGAFFDHPVLLLFASGSALLFWLIEAYWKTFQSANYRRIEQIEAFLRGEGAAIDPLQISATWSASFHKAGARRFFKILFWGHVVLPHGVMCAAFAAAYLLVRS